MIYAYCETRESATRRAIEMLEQNQPYTALEIIQRQRLDERWLHVVFGERGGRKEDGK